MARFAQGKRFFCAALFFNLVFPGTGVFAQNGGSPPVSPPVPPALTPSVSPSPAVSKPGDNASMMIPDGFVRRPLMKGETLSGICKADSSCEIILMKVNRIDQRHLSTGRNILVPVDKQKSSRYVPVPKVLSDSRGEREIRIFLKRQFFGAYEKGQLSFWGPISSGKSSKRTPAGRFFVNYKQRFKRSIKYDDAPMPFSINFNQGYFLHQQSLPGYPASHGCVRLLEVDAQRLFYWVKLGDPVTLVLEP
ncbi:MAG: L,D-transpeptidase [Chlorobiaceae bacterium]|nr:L,D-transpeptidase [Chlorobiaceae bacterium]NTV61327.1 L,D-transpeptidase [Chlorobiaceae bacterium]